MSTYVQNPGHHQNVRTPGRAHAKASYFGIAASILMLLGSLLPWVEASLEGQSETIKGTEGDGVWTLVAAIVAIVLFAVGVATRKAMISASATVPALLAVALGAWNIADPERLARVSIEDKGIGSEELDAVLKQFDFAAMAGLWVVVVAAVSALVCGVLAARAKESGS
ncbi:hypothetical protein [Embleya sp. NBC_00896]|uniref:hypothetical protein n=1 Tax=Embleya sp. NBC_00896 TaxID=2975961 RepID=UPI003869A747|nr:hypothetical protein OG928_14765 [Embleya sp. NBC_00896]